MKDERAVTVPRGATWSAECVCTVCANRINTRYVNIYCSLRAYHQRQVCCHGQHFSSDLKRQTLLHSHYTVRDC